MTAKSIYIREYVALLLLKILLPLVTGHMTLIFACGDIINNPVGRLVCSYLQSQTDYTGLAQYTNKLHNPSKNPIGETNVSFGIIKQVLCNGTKVLLNAA